MSLNRFCNRHSRPFGRVALREPLSAHAPEPAVVIDPAAGQVQPARTLAVVHCIHRRHQFSPLRPATRLQVELALADAAGHQVEQHDARFD